MRHEVIPTPFPDPMGLGQPKLARIHLRIADDTLRRAAPHVIDTADVFLTEPGDTRAMWSRMLKREIEIQKQARAVLEAYQP